MKEPASPQRSVAARRGRGALSNREGRYERTRVDWDAPDLEPDPESDDTPPPLPTTVTPEKSRSIIATNDSPDVGFDQSINPYRGCEHGCVYCFARPTHAWLGLSPGLDFETKLFSKPDAARLLREELRRPGYVCRTIALGANTDAYQPIERDLRLTRGVLEVLSEHRHPVIVITKSDLVLRDLDLLAPMATLKLAAVMVSITTLDRRLARRMEPRAAIPEKRLDAVRRLTEAGVPVGVLTAPVIPGLNDSELESILEASADAGAVSAGYVLLRLPLEIKDLFREWLETHYALKADRVLALLKEMRGGRLYDARFGKRMSGEGPHAALLHQRFTVALRRLGLRHRALPLDTTLFRVPPGPGDQGRLFDR
ncbi:MAG TPA: PA0069 family radical SAM protein [Candidatus Polarisedimenticolia bacterium]|nr:PA0069 family radical SAM protein [Candidatus Polarisedimenticolia bacterium]